MSITLNGHVIADLSPNGVFGWPGGLGVRQLRFSVKWLSRNRPKTLIARNFRAAVALSRSTQDSKHIGMAWPERTWVIRTHEQFTNDGAILFHLDLTDAQVAAIESQRLGGDLRFNLHIMCEVSDGDNIADSSDEVRFLVNKSEWIKCLTSVGVSQMVLLEVDVPKPEGPLSAAAELLQLARAELDGGNYDGVVQQCRRAIESVDKTLKRQPSITAAIKQYNESREGREKMTKRDRALFVTAAVKHYAHPAHHVEEDGQTYDFGRRDAMFMLALACAVVSNAMGSIDSRKRSASPAGSRLKPTA